MADNNEGEGHEGEGGQGGAGGGGGGEPAGGGVRLSAEDRESIVAEVVAQLRGALSGDGGGSDGGGEGDGAGPPTGGRLIDQEAWFEQVVRRELEKVRTAEDLGNLKEEVKKIVERPPKQYRRVTRAMWGSGDED